MLDTENFAAFIMHEYGLSLVGHIKMDGGFHYLGSTDDKKGKKPFRYCVHLDDPPNVYYNDLKRGIRGTWYPKGQGQMSKEDREKWWRDLGLRKAKQDAETKTKQDNAAKLARIIWTKAKHADQEHPYLVLKDVHPHGLRQLLTWKKRVYQDDGSYQAIIVENALLVPMHDEHGKIEVVIEFLKKTSLRKI